MQTLTELLESFSSRDKLAIKFLGDYRTFAWTYRELYRDAKKFAAVLGGRGIKAGDKVVIWGPNGPEWAVAFFGCVAAGAVAVPVDFKSSVEHAERILAASGAVLTVKSRSRPALSGPSILFEGLFETLRNAPELCQPQPAKAEDTAELVYTSGTTGNPKGVVISHANILSNIEAVVRRINVGPDDTFLSVLPMSHLFEQTGGFLAPLYIGGAIVYLSTIKPSAILAALKNEPITILEAVPRLLFGLKNGIRQKFDGPKSFILKTLFDLSRNWTIKNKKRSFFFIHRKFNRKFRFFVSGGSCLDPDTEEFWEGMGFKVVQGYGLTECSPILTANPEHERRKGSIGLALDNVELELAPDNELLAKGPNVFTGYYNDPEKTGDTFRDGWFLTGDIADRDRDGYYYIRGRKKDLIVTMAGVNVYPDEIEAILNEIPGVKESAVIGVADDKGEAVAAAIIPLAPDADLKAIVAQANSKLESGQQITRTYLWPETEFPKTTTLKVKKNIVREKFGVADGGKDKGGSGLSAVGKVLADITKAPDVTIVPEAKLYADLRLDSIGRIELVSRLEQEFSLDFEEELINQETTVRLLEEMVAKKAKLATNASFPHWTYGPTMRRIRVWLLENFFLKVLGHWCRVEVRGLSNLTGIAGPAILAPNHLSYFDQPILLSVLPRQWRQDLATAAWDEFFRPPINNPLFWFWKRLMYRGACAFGGIFGLSQKNNFKKTLRFAGSLADRGISLLIFPEGERSRDGKMLPLKKGVALMAQNLQLPVVPVKIQGADNILRRGRGWPRKGLAKVIFGTPIKIGNSSYDEFLNVLKEEIEKLK